MTKGCEKFRHDHIWSYLGYLIQNKYKTLPGPDNHNMQIVKKVIEKCGHVYDLAVGAKKKRGQTMNSVCF